MSINKTATRLLVLCSGLAACTPLFRFPAIRVQNTPTERDQPTYAALTLLASDTIEYQLHGSDRVSASLTRYRQVKVFTREGARFATVHLPFSASHKLIYIAGRTHWREDDVEHLVVMPDSAITVNRPYPGIRDIGEATFMLPDVRPGAVFEYVAMYELPEACLLEAQPLRDPLAILRSEFTVIAPHQLDFDLLYLEDGVVKPALAVGVRDLPPAMDGKRFINVDLKALVSEEQMPARARIGPAVWPIVRGMRGSDSLEMRRWDDVGKWIAKHYGLLAPAGPEDGLDKLQESYAKAIGDVTVVDSGLLLGSQSKLGGNDAVSAGLELYQRMRNEGLAVSLGLVSREANSLFLVEAPSPAVFDAVVVVAQIDSSIYYFDPMCVSCSTGQVSASVAGASVVAMLPTGPKIGWLPVRRPLIVDADRMLPTAAKVDRLPEATSIDNSTVLAINGKLGNQGEVTGVLSATLSGGPAARTKTVIKSVDAAGLTTIFGLSSDVHLTVNPAPSWGDMTPAIELSAKVTAQCQDKGDGNLVCPLSTWATKVLPEVWREYRRQDLLLSELGDQKLELALDLPANGHVEPTPSVDIKSPFGVYQLSVVGRDGLLVIERHLEIAKRRILVDEYERFYEFLRRVRAYDTQTITVNTLVEDTPPPPPKRQKNKGKK